MNLNNGVLGECLKLFTDNLKTFAITRLKEVFGETWVEKALNPPGKDSSMTIKKTPEEWDLAIIVSMIHDHWDHVFSKVVERKFPKAMLTVVKHFRNEYSHQQQMSNRDIYRAIDLILHILEKLQLDTGNIEARRQELLRAMMAQVSQVDHLRPVFCRGCKSSLSLKFAFECSSCHLIGCVRCLKDYHDRQVQLNILFSCPDCSKPISEYDKDLLNLQLKYLSI